MSTNTAPLSSSVSSSPQSWLDLLQLEVCERIAHFVIGNDGSREGRGPDTLALAYTSPLQRNAVLASTKYQFFVWNCNDIPKWSNIFQSCVREVYLDQACMDVDAVALLLKSPTLRKVELLETPDYLIPLKNSPHVKSLTVQLQITDHTLLMDVVSTLQLTKLELECVHKYSSSVPPEPEGCFKDICKRFGNGCLSRRCQNLTDLDISCRYCEASTLVTIIEGLPSLKRLGTGTESLDATLVSALRSIDSVQLWTDEGADLAIRVGTPVTWLLVGDATTNFSGLEQCSQLEHLGLHLFGNRSEMLAEVMPKLRSLRSLELNWEDHEPESILEPSEESSDVLKIVASGHHLQKLRLDGNIIENVADQELIQVFQLLGPRLRKFAMPIQVIRMTRGSPHERLATILEALGKYNTSLEELWMHTYFDRHIARWNNVTTDELKARVDHVELAKACFDRRLPGVLDTSFDEIIIEACGFVDEDMQLFLDPPDDDAPDHDDTDDEEMAPPEIPPG